ncbi:MAG TPA: histidine phosphatase family protein [Bacteroidales bacterium]|nr:histidine phosphatase family protein [Bacteroidales bacterium]
MKTLFLIRHAEAKQCDIPDHKRPLTKEGIASVNKLGAYLNNASLRFDGIITSHAVRASETAHYIAELTGFPENKIITKKQLYATFLNTYFDVIFEQPDEINNLAIIGHNPQITDFANYFLKDITIFLFPSNMVALHFYTDKWTDICMAEKELFFVWPPVRQ